jgi:hypothetical protein
MLADPANMTIAKIASHLKPIVQLHPQETAQARPETLFGSYRRRSRCGLNGQFKARQAASTLTTSSRKTRPKKAYPQP